MDGIKAIMDIDDTIHDILSRNEDPYKAIGNALVEHMPSATSKDNILWEYHISANKIFVKTDNFISFGWSGRTIKDQETGKYMKIYNFFLIIYGAYIKVKEDLLTADGWVVMEDEQ